MTASEPEPRSALKTVIEVDLVSYSDVARLLEENLNVEAVKTFEDEIQKFIDDGLRAVGLIRTDAVLGTSGDNAILMFDDGATMHRFAETVQQRTLVHNKDKSLDSAKRWFRMGAATGAVLAVPEQRRSVGSAIARATRLEAAAAKGQLVIDRATFETLPAELKRCYGEEEVIPGKRDERFAGRRCTFIDLAGEALRPESAVGKGSYAISVDEKSRDELLLIYDLYRTCYLNQKYYGFKAREFGETAYETLFRRYLDITSRLRLVVEEIRIDRGLSKRGKAGYLKARQVVLELEKLDEPNPDRRLVRRFEREVNREIPPDVLWFPDATR